jgi:hypothetical protein
VLTIADLDSTHESIQSRRGGFGKSFLQTESGSDQSFSYKYKCHPF